MAILINRNEARTRQSPAVFRHYSWWDGFLGETRTRILLLYIALMLMVTAIAVPVFLVMLFNKVDERVQEELTVEMQEFRNAYRLWEQRSDRSDASLQRFLNSYLALQVPKSDHFLIAIFDDQLYRSNPSNLPDVLRPNSNLAKRWINIDRSVAGKEKTTNPDVGSVLYQAQPMVVRGRIRGTYVVVRRTAAAQEEVFDVVIIFIRVAIGVVIISSIIAWFIMAQMLAPVKRLATTARSISESDLAQRIPQMKGSDEMAELTETFNAMMNRLQNAFISQRNFLNDAGHELRTPITIIQGHLELLGDDPQERQETLDLVMDELDRMSRMINDLILLAKAERPDFLQLETIDIPALTKELFIKSQALANRNWQLQIVGKGRMVGDRQRLTGAILNLLHNATHHTQPGDLIELGSSITRKEVRFWVRDTGEGIAPDDQHRIFERFARASNSYRRSEGAGLGLAIVRAIVEAHGGRVDLFSQLGVGSTFTLILPVDPPVKRLFQ